ncbi:MAG: SusD/RagB family nutrient-binding outer membrane lipoprotein [Tannerellaceae bacterium]
MNIKHLIANGLTLCLLLSSCSKFDDINTNPDAATKATASMMATALILNITKQGGNKVFVYDNMLSKQIGWAENAASEQYNLFGRTSFDNYTILITAKKMLEASSDIDKDSYTGLALFLKAYKLFYASLEVGDIPYSDALKGEEGVQKPKYDTQKDVMLQILNDLDESYALFSKGRKFDGDPIFEGNPDNWKKTVTAFQLKVLLHLSKKEADADLNIAYRFAQIVSLRDLFTSNSDNLQLVYSNKAGQIYPFYKTETKHADYAMLSNVIIDNFKNLNDYRLFYYASPSKYQLENGIDESDWSAYLSIDPSALFSDLSELAGEDKFCKLNTRYTNRPEGEPLIRLGYAEQNFILAEAALRGWIKDDANELYKKGIRASMDFITTNTPNEVAYHHNRAITDAYIDSYLAQEMIQLTGSKEADLEKIILQRYLASFMQHPYDAYFDYRRTGYPKLPINPESNMNPVKDKIPVRWMYPEAEFNFNGENANEAVNRQFGGVDDVNKLMWILQ